MSASETVSRILTESVVTVAETRAIIHESTGQRPEKTTIQRWMHRGVGGVKLEHVRLGSQLLTSVEAINRFITARTAAQ